MRHTPTGFCIKACRGERPRFVARSACVPDPAPNLDQAIRDNASQPAKASVDGQSVEQHPLKDQIEADRYLASKDAARKPGLGIKFAKIVPPGSV